MAIQMRLFADDGLVQMREPLDDEDDNVEEVSLGECECEADCEFCADPHEIAYEDWCDSCDCLDCWEKAMSIWEVPWIFNDEAECSYLNGYPEGVWSRLACDYDSCTPQELKKFVQDRGLHHLDPYPAGLTLKFHYMRLFKDADLSRQFHYLMDMPPELRNEVYQYLLHFPNGCASHEYCHPAILQTCKEINEEASSVLYSENVIRCCFAAFAGSHGSGDTYVFIHNTDDNGTLGALHDQDLEGLKRFPQAIEAYPEFLRRITHLRLALHYEVQANSHAVPPESYATLNHLVFSLASFLMEGNKLKTLDIELRVDENVTASGLGHILYPLRRLRNIRQVNVTGTPKLPKTYLPRLQHDMQREFEPAFNTMRHWQVLATQAASILELVYLFRPSTGCGDYGCHECYEGLARLDRIRNPLDDLMHSRNRSFFNSQREEVFLAKLGLLERALNLIDFDALRRQIDTIAEARKKKQSHDLASDDGRLQEALKIWEGKLHNTKAINEAADDWPVEEDAVSPEL